MENRFEEILDLAIKYKCTDVHLRLFEERVEIELRGIEGLKRIKSENNDVKLFNYLMYRSHIDITDKIPQSGSFNHFFNGIYYDFRFAVIITEKITSGVLRILNCHNGLPIEKITYEKQMQNLLMSAMKRKNGLVIFSGPTGSGKTTTMYSLLKLLNSKTIYSLEDPIEVIQENIVQLEVNEKRNFGFAEGIRQILRHNPDVLMIGEIRDENTAKMAIRAALTGCLVVSSLHASTTYGSLHRLLDLGGNKDDICDCCAAIFNQRLVKLKEKKGYTCLFDYLDNEGINQYFQYKTTKETIDIKITRAIENGDIEDENS